MQNTVIKVENLGKSYRIGEIGSGSFQEDFHTWCKSFYKNSKVDNKTKFSRPDHIWALKNVNFEVKRGEILGIIGKNGAGKSTILKILSRITKPTTGKALIKGRIASLLEVGTGFHPELTGRENIFLNGAILGMTKSEIKESLDEIIDFSGIDYLIDTPVKRYSSGLMVRLGFAVAGHLNADIIIVDEVLAVGDADFQKRAIGKIKDISSSKNRTVLFVSHNMTSILGLCSRALLLENGTIKSQGDTHSVVENYIKQDTPDNSFDLSTLDNFEGNGKLKIGALLINGEKTNNIFNTDKIKISIEVLNNNNIAGKLEIAGSIRDSNGHYLHYFSSKLKSIIFNIKNAKHWFNLEFKSLPLNQGTYTIGFELKLSGEIVYRVNKALEIEVYDNDFYNSGISWHMGKILIDQKWSETQK